MEMQVLPWIEDDVAIEIIGKMIADQNRSLLNVIEAFKISGFNRNSPEVKANKDYQYHQQRIKELHAEIQQLYKGEERRVLIDKAFNEYAPYIKGRLQSRQVAA